MKIIFLILLNILFLFNLNGQEQTYIPQYISKKFQEYCKTVPREEVFIHTDKDDYISGEELWFSIYLINRKDLKPSQNSKIVYFEVLNPDNKPVIQKRILTAEGFGPGQIVLPDTLSSGTYTIRAYTNWMKNFLPQNCFMKDIQVYNISKNQVFRRSIKSLESNDAETYVIPSDSSLILNINNLKPDSLEMFIQTNEKFRSRNKNLIYLLIQTRGTINHLTTEKTIGDITRIAFPKKSLPGGINQITVFDSDGPVCDRLIYTSPDTTPALTIFSIDSCNKRNKITLGIELNKEFIQFSDKTNLSISVSPETNRSEFMDINDYMIFGTEFGILPYSKINGRKITEHSPEIMDSLLLNVKSNWINWEKVFSNDELIFEYPIENGNHYLSGTLFNSRFEPASAGEILIMSFPDKPAEFQYTSTNKNGNFNFRLGISEESKNLIIQPNNLSEGQKINIKSSFSDQYIQNEIFIDSINNNIPSFLQRQIINFQIKEVYGTSTTGKRIATTVPTNKPERFYGKPDFELDMKNFIELDSMQEVFFELVPNVSLERINSAYEFSITNQSRIKIEGTPCVMIDGVIIKDYSVIAGLDPAYVDKIHVVNSKYRVGGYIFNGIVNLISKKGVFDDKLMPVDALKLQYSVIDTICSFVSPEYSSQELFNSPVADFRNTLIWNPSIKPDYNGKATIEFWSADIKTEYIVNIQGILPSGKPVSQRKTIKIR